MRTWLARAVGVLLRRRREERLSEEVQAHLDLLTDDHIGRGLSPAEARLAARKSFGGVDQIKEVYRDQRGFRFIDELRQDLRFAGRLLSRDPLFAITAALSLAIGIGANTTVFTIANALLFRPPTGMRDSGRLVDISRRSEGGGFGVNEISFPNFLDLRERVTTFDDLCAYDFLAEPMSLVGESQNAGAERVFGNTVTPNYFAVLGVDPAVGRFFNPLMARSTVVLSHRFWTRRFNEDPAVVGRALKVNGQVYTVAGVAAEAFLGTSMIATDLWLPIDMNPEATSFLRRRELNWGVARGRLKSGVPLSQAAAEVDAIGRALAAEYPDQNRGQGLGLLSASLIPGNLSVPLAGVMTLILAFVSLVLAVACANLAGLLLARAGARRREIAVRLALGAGRARLVRQLLAETMVLFVLGGAIGVLLARVLTALIISFMPALPVPLDVSMPLDVRVLLFTTALSLVAAIACGLVPALESAKSDVISTLKNGAPGTSGRTRLRNSLVVVQVALSIVLVIGAGVFARALQKATSIETGFDAHGVELAELDLTLAGYTRVTAPPFARLVAERVRELPDVEQASVAATLPTTGQLRLGILTLPGVEVTRGRSSLDANWNAVEPGYFATMRIPLTAGRDFDAGDLAGAPPLAIVSETAQRNFWPGESAIGKSLLLSPSVLVRGQPNNIRTLVVVGVARDVRMRAGVAPRPYVYLPLQQQFVSRVTVVARSVSGTRIAGALRGAIAASDPNLPILSSQTLEESAALGRLPQRVAAIVSGGLGVVSLLLAAIGIYAVTAYAVAQRTREIGIRVALGAAHTQVVVMMVRVGMVLVATGSAIGLTVAAVANWTLPRLLAGFPPMDGLAFGGAVVLFIATGLTACYVPARRAARLDPAATLRND